MPFFVMLLELNGVEMFIDANVSGVTETYNYKSNSWSKITFSPKHCNCEKRDPYLNVLLQNLTKEFMYKKFPYNDKEKSEITLQSIELGEIILYNRNQDIETDIDLYHCKVCWNKQNWN